MSDGSDYKLKCAKDCRVLSIQSHVVRGYVGNKCAVFPLQLHGFEVDAINSVQFSNHTHYSHFKGQILNSEQLFDVYEGLRLNNLHHYSHVLTGYCANESFLEKIADIVKEQKSLNPKLLYFCDPVLGDNGRYYVPEKLMPIFRDVIIPLADVVTPNQFELSQLTGMDIRSEADCLEAMRQLHSLGPKQVVVTSSDLSSDPDKIAVYGSTSLPDGSFDRYRFEIARLSGFFVGTGDVFTSLLIAWLHHCDNRIKCAVEKVLATIQTILRRTLTEAKALAGEGNVPDCGQVELRLIQSRDDILEPKLRIESTKL